MPINTLYEYFTSKGQKLPTVEERRKLYGLGPEYTGTTEQNVSLLQKLISGAGQEKTITPTVSPTLPGLGGEVAARALGTPAEGAVSPQDKLIADLTSRLTAYTAAPTLTAEKKRLEEEKGVLGMRERVGSFEEEMATTQTLLDQLEGDITKRTQEFLVSEPARRRILAVERQPLLEQLGIAERGLAATTGKLARTEQDILTELGLLEKEKTMPLDLFERELNIRSKIQELTKQAIPNIATSQFNDEGDLTIVTQDPTTGAFGTQTIKGIGQKADKYQSISSATDDQGNLTIIGITRDGKSEVIGTFKGVAGTRVGAGIPEEKTIEQQLSDSKGDDGYADPGTYQSLKRTSGMGPDEFDKRYGNMLSPQERKNLGVKSTAVTGEQFLTKDWIINTYGQDALIAKAIEDGYGKGIGSKAMVLNKYLEDAMKSIEAWRQAGKSDEEILAEMQKK